MDGKRRKAFSVRFGFSEGNDREERRNEGDDENAYGMKKRTKARKKRIKQQKRRMSRERDGSRRDASNFGPDGVNAIFRRAAMRTTIPISSVIS